MADAAVTDDKSHPRNRGKGIQRHIGPARLHDPVHRHGGIQALVHEDPDAISTPQPSGSQDLREPVAALCELTVSEALPAESDRIAIRIPLCRAINGLG